MSLKVTDHRSEPERWSNLPDNQLWVVCVKEDPYSWFLTVREVGNVETDCGRIKDIFGHLGLRLRTNPATDNHQSSADRCRIRTYEPAIAYALIVDHFSKLAYTGSMIRTPRSIVPLLPV